ncbi:MAG: class I SAM-dependent methyltransferase [Nitrosopumilus sp.]|nr:class I SAM-dependent methyltransferase [Nitrosopumilus sp.]
MENNQGKSESFDGTYDEKPEMFGHPYKELQHYFKNCPITGDLLDLGSGQGRDSLFFASIGYNVTAVDSSRVGIQQMLYKAESSGFKIDGIVDDIQNLKLEKKFNVILFDMLLHGFEDSTQLELLGKYSNSLKNKGIICIVYPDDFKADHFMNMLKSLASNWNLLDEIIINDIPKIEGEIIEYKFKMMVAQLS